MIKLNFNCINKCINKFAKIKSIGISSFSNKHENPIHETSMTKEKVTGSLFLFLLEELGEYKTQIYKDTLVERDLGITGDDAVDFIVKYSEKFTVDITDFEYSRYFNHEPAAFRFFRKVEPLSIGDLENGIHSGRLV
jgi:hypothetical protein